MQHTPPPAAAQFALLCALRVVDPLTFTQIFPYINQLLSALHLVDDPAKVGFYSGLVESTFTFFQLCSIYQWARLSDSVGRRPVVLATTFGLALATFLFGFASSLPVILLSRAIAGTCSGNAAVLHSILGELTNPANEAVAFSTYGLFWPLGSVIGPVLGGALADPAAYYLHVRIFQNQFFRDYPYFLPSFVTGFLAFVVGCLALGLLRETHPARHSQPVLSPITAAATEQGSPQPQPHHPHPHPNVQPVSLRGLLQHPVLRKLALSGALLCFTATAFDALFVLFCYTPVQLGGLSFTAPQIATSLALAGASSIILQVTLLPPLLRHVSHARVYTICMVAWPITYAVVPLLNLIARRGAVQSWPAEKDSVIGIGTESGIDVGGAHGWGEEGPRLTVLATYGLWAAIAGVMTLSRVGCLAYSVSLVLVKQNAPSPAALGKANGVVLWAMCLARAGAPAFVSSFFAWSTTHRLLGGYLWLVVMLAFAVAGCVVSRGIERAIRGKGRGKRVSASELEMELDGAEGEEPVRGMEWEPVEAARERVKHMVAEREREREGSQDETAALLQPTEDDGWGWDDERGT